MIQIVGVHGVNAFASAATNRSIADEWTQHLSLGGLGLRALDLDIAYYAPALRKRLPQGISQLEALDPVVLDSIEDWLANFPLPEGAHQGRLTRPIRLALEWIAIRYGLDSRVVTSFVARFFAEVATYFDAQDRTGREAARRIVARSLDQHRPRVVIAHSLGTVVTYEALCNEPGPHVELLLTLGSPLAMPNVVIDRLEPASGAHRVRPARVGRWINVADTGDIIAVPRQLSRSFDGIERDYEISIGSLAFHSIRQYLRSPDVRQILADHLGS